MHARTKAVLAGTAALLTVGLVAPAPAGAVTGGIEDRGNTYANVGMLAFYDDGGRYRCSGTLVSPTVVVTAAHCTAGTEGDTIVSFDPVIDEAPPSDLPVAGDTAAGYGPADELPAGWHRGTAHTHPRYSDFTDQANWNDVGVVVLDEAVAGIAPAQLAAPNELDRYAQPRLNHTAFRVVGYGTEVRQADSGPQKPTPMSYPILRRYTDVVGQKLTPQILQVNGNEHDVRAGGGTCFGDSGGPSFAPDSGHLVTVTSYGYTSNCRYIDGLQRVDVPVVQSWLATFGVTPAAG
ncbi:Trypsin [Geodermatophilus telluris]|uniref:Trypsin n=1 Tax=Geodermatophilus telluris TaxID=1190417 RepID=A0A1G6UCL9_9ACTN|nr:trypsin-like serine protease [Geodermatophilus telluris]SDD39128.1 Trypsin [Geodermatophilus telluris]